MWAGSSDFLNKIESSDYIFNVKMTINYLDNISKSRSFLMGVAIIWVFMLHSPKSGFSFIDSFASLGWCGVDIFIFLSAIGLCFSLKKSPEIVPFYKRRLIRIIPTWMVILLGVHILGAIVVAMKPELPFYHPHTPTQMICWYTGIGYWISGFVNGQKYEYFYEWYIPTLLLFYVFAPLLFKQSKRSLIVLFVLSIVIVELMSYYEILYYLHFSYQRIPIFILGFIICHFSSAKENKTLIISSFVFFIISIFILIANSRLNLEISKSTVALFMLPLVLLLISFVSKISFIIYIGTVSLELYLLHLYGRPQYLVSLLVDNVLVSNIIAFFLCLFAAILLHKTMNVLPGLVKKKCLTNNN